MSPYRTTPDDDLIRALRNRLPANEVDGGSVPAEDIASAEAQLGFRLPPLLRRIYESIDGGIGPGYGLYPLVDGKDTLVAMYLEFANSKYVPEPGEPGYEPGAWPERLLPIVDWGCAMWSCLDLSDGQRSDRDLVQRGALRQHRAHLELLALRLARGCRPLRGDVRAGAIAAFALAASLATLLAGSGGVNSAATMPWGGILVR